MQENDDDSYDNYAEVLKQLVSELGIDDKIDAS